jgi:hypothetical protein
MAETQVYQENYQIKVKALLYISLRLFLTKKCLSTVSCIRPYKSLSLKSDKIDSFKKVAQGIILED